MTSAIVNVSFESLGRPLWKAALTLTTSLVGLTNAAAAATVEQPVAAEEAADESAGTSGGEIIVTAQRRSERLEDVPMSISVASADEITNSGGLTLHNLQSLTPGVLIGFGGANTQPAIRGVTTIVAGAAGENNVAVYVDGFYKGDPAAINQDLANISSVQVLKGPQGSLYGRNATGGAILVTTLPASKVWTGKFDAGYASFDEKTFSGYLSGPLAEGLRVSLAAYSRTSDGYLYLADPITRLATDTPIAPNKSQAVRAELEVDLSDNITIEFGYNFNLVNDPRTLKFTPFAFISPTIPQSALPLSQDLDVKALNNETRYENRTNEGTVAVTIDTGIGTLKARGSLARTVLDSEFDQDGSFADLSRLDNIGRFKTSQASVDFNFDKIGDLDLVVGAEYYNDVREINPINTYSNGVLSTLTATKTSREAYAAFIDATYSVTDSLSISAGGRYSHEKAGFDITVQTRAQIPLGTFTLASNPVETSFNAFTPRAAIRYEIAPQTSVYVSYSKGFKSGGWSGPPLLMVRPEKISAYEAGFKIARRTFRFDAAAFYYDYKDIQVSVNVRDPFCTAVVCGIRPLLTNGPKSEIYGVDGQLTLFLAERLNVRLGAAYLHARYLSFPNANGTGLSSAGLNLTNQVQDWSNKEMPRTPSISGNINIDYTQPTRFGDITLSTNATMTSSFVVSNPSIFGPDAGPMANEQRYRQGGYVQLNVQVQWVDPSKHFSVTGFVRNLTDKRYWINYAGTGFGDYGVLSTPRVIGVRAGYRF